MKSALFLLPGMLLLACASPKLSKRVPGTWFIDHYNEWTADTSTGHALDSTGYLTFHKNGTGEIRLIPGRPHGAFSDYYPSGNADFRWHLRDSFVVITDRAGHTQQEWLVTSNYDIYMAWVSVNSAGDSVRTLYLYKQ